MVKLDFTLNGASSPKKVLVIGAGGGNDSFSCFLLLSHLKSKGFNPDHIDVAAMLPSCLDYFNIVEAGHPLLCEVRPESIRKAGAKEMTAFPEKMLSAVKDDLPFKKIDKIFGIRMSKGSQGVKQALEYLISLNNYDLVFAIDVGGDFITEDLNTGVLSPQMDGYVSWALQQLEQKYNILYGVFGLGTDGESSGDWLEKAINRANEFIVEKGKIEVTPAVQKVMDIYRSSVEPNRYSRTTDYTIKEITQQNHENPSMFRCRLHVKTGISQTKKFYATYLHTQNEEMYGQYLVLSSIRFVANRYCVSCGSADEWVKQVHLFDEKVNHEMCGQTEEGTYYCLPSWRFSQKDRQEIVELAVTAFKQHWYDEVVFYATDLARVSHGLAPIELSKNLVKLRH